MTNSKTTAKRVIELAATSLHAPWQIKNGRVVSQHYTILGPLHDVWKTTDGDFICFARNESPKLAKALIIAIATLEEISTGYVAHNDTYALNAISKLNKMFSEGGDV